MSAPRSVLIVGAGVVGLSAAYQAARRGHRVRVVERCKEDHPGCSWGNAGLVVPSHFIPLAAPGMVAKGLRWMLKPDSPFYIKPRLSADLLGWGWRFYRSANARHVARSAPLLRDLHLASRALFEELAALPGVDFGLRNEGLLVLCRSSHALNEEEHAAEEARSLGLAPRVLSPAEAARLEPGLRLDIAGAVHFPEDCHLDPARFMRALRRLAEDAGVEVSWETEVTGWRVEGRRLAAARTPRGELAADEHVLCAGSWSQSLARSLDLRLPLQAGKGYSLTLHRPPRLPAIPMILSEARVAVTPMGESLRFGGTMELAGLDESVTPRRVEGIIRSAGDYLPDFPPEAFRGVSPWRGLRPCSPDGLPYVGRTAAYSNLAIATGHAMLGLSLGPITGKVLAEILDGESPCLDVTLLSPERYGRCTRSNG